MVYPPIPCPPEYYLVYSGHEKKYHFICYDSVEKAEQGLEYFKVHKDEMLKMIKDMYDENESGDGEIVIKEVITYLK